MSVNTIIIVLIKIRKTFSNFIIGEYDDDDQDDDNDNNITEYFISNNDPFSFEGFHHNVHEILYHPSTSNIDGINSRFCSTKR